MQSAERVLRGEKCADFVAVGHLRDEKDPLTLMDAARRLAEPLSIVHVGNPLDEALAAAARRTMADCPHYRWLGGLGAEDTRQWIAGARALVHMSRIEGGANVVIEAVSSQVPVLASRIDGNVGLLGSGYEGYFPVGDAPALASAYGQELSTEDWLRVLRQGREIGATQLGFSGGEPLVRDDLEIMVAEARKLGYYSNLITSGVGLNEKRISAFKEGGLDHIQLSFQDSTKELNDFLSSTKTFDLKARVAKLIKQYDYPMVLNVVLHRHNLDHVDRIIEMDPPKRVVGLKNVTINEPFFQGHFPGHPIMPGVLIVEAMAQVGGMLLMGAVPDPEKKVVYFT